MADLTLAQFGWLVWALGLIMGIVLSPVAKAVYLALKSLHEFD